jgi:thioredoxin reductase (NADPH)
MKSKLIILGSGPAGLTAAIYAGRAQLKPILFTGTAAGGQLMNTTIVDNYPGFPDGIDGPKLMLDMMKQAEKYGTEMVRVNAEKVDFSGDVKKVWADGKEYEADCVIVATGASPRRLNIPGEDKFYGHGVSTCAVCDGAFYKDKVVALVGGGDTAMEDSSYLSKFASKVYLMHRRDEFRAGPIMQERVLNNPKIEILWNTEVTEVLGEDKVTGVKAVNNKDKTEKILNVDGFFLAIGNIPNTEFLKGQIELDENGYAAVTDDTKTNVDGVFIAGEIQDPIYKQAITSAGIGCKAAMDAEKWLLAKNL